MKTITDEMKDFSSEIKDSSVETDILNPFVHRLELDTTYDKLKTAFLTVALLPLRLALITGLVIFAWLLACLGLHGLSDEDLRRTPLTGWRRHSLDSGDLLDILPYYYNCKHVHLWGIPSIEGEGPKSNNKRCTCSGSRTTLEFLRRVTGRLPRWAKYRRKSRDGKNSFLWKKIVPWLCFVGQLTYRAAGMKIVIRGKQASRSEAPIMVVAPHSTFIDGGIVYILGFPSTIVRRESGLNPFVGKLINYTQPVYVWRDDPNSRQNTIKEIIERTTSKEDWPQIMIFPEGTCTNRSCLITFKCGAFYPGVPVQPVCIRYPNKLDTVTWTWEGPGPLKLLWLTLTQLNSSCEIEFLPVYKPNEAEKTDPKLYANNVRRVMAQALGIPVSDYTYDDCRIISKAHSLNLPNAFSILDTHKLRSNLGLQNNKVEQELIQKRSSKIDEAVDFDEFARILRLDPKDPSVQQLFKIHDKSNKGYVDMEEYIFTVLAIEKANSVLDLLAIAFDVCSVNSSRCFNIQKLRKVLRFSLQLDAEESDKIFLQVNRDSSEYDSVSLEEIITVLRTRTEFNHLFTADSDDRKKKTT